MRRLSTVGVVLILVGVFAAACARRQPPLAAPPPPPAAAARGDDTAAAAAGPAPERVEDALPVPPEPLSEDAIANRSLDELNRDSPFRPCSSSSTSPTSTTSGRGTAQSNADLLKKYRSWVVTVEGHCDERGTAEYNLALGERRAVAVKTYLVSLGIAPDRIRTVSYGKEFPFDPGHNENAWTKNRRAHFVITSK